MMSPNGRRAWRKWVRRVEHNPKLRPPGKSISRLAREGKRHLGSIPPTPPKSFTSRSLVGMTMGARKRAAWYEALRSNHDGDGGPISNRKLRLCLRSALTVRVLAVTVPIEWRLEVRAKYRIGERLRPCPGCHTCMPGVKGWHIDKVRGRFKMPTVAWSCDGSGVLPARARKVRR